MPLGDLPGDLRCLVGDLWRLAGDMPSLAEKPLRDLLQRLETLLSLRDLLLYVSGDWSLAEDLPFPAEDLPFPAEDLPFPAGDLPFPAADLPFPAGDLVCAEGDLLCLADEARALADDLLRFVRGLFGIAETSCADACRAGAGACKEISCAGDQPRCLVGLACLAAEASAAEPAWVIAASASAAQL